MFRRPVASSGPKIACREPRFPTVCVVDPRVEDYGMWQDAHSALGVELRIVGSAAEALALARTEKVDLWVVNSDLPGISGSELCAMLKSQHAAATVCIVADEYSPTAERTALAARATLFLCKPAHTAWLAEWLENLRRASAPRAAAPRPAVAAMNR